MTRARTIDLAAAGLAAALLLRAALVGGPRLGALLSPGPGDLHEAVHTRIACCVWVGALGFVGWTLRESARSVSGVERRP